MLKITSNHPAPLKTRDIPTLTNRPLRLNNNGCNPPSPPDLLCTVRRDPLQNAPKAYFTLSDQKDSFKGCKVSFLKIDVTEIVVHKAHQPNTVVDFHDNHGLTRKRSAEINFLFENADPSHIRGTHGRQRQTAEARDPSAARNRTVRSWKGMPFL